MAESFIIGPIGIRWFGFQLIERLKQKIIIIKKKKDGVACVVSCVRDIIHKPYFFQTKTSYFPPVLSFSSVFPLYHLILASSVFSAMKAWKHLIKNSHTWKERGCHLSLTVSSPTTSSWAPSTCWNAHPALYTSPHLTPAISTPVRTFYQPTQKNPPPKSTIYQ